MILAVLLSLVVSCTVTAPTLISTVTDYNSGIVYDNVMSGTIFLDGGVIKFDTDSSKIWLDSNWKLDTQYPRLDVPNVRKATAYGQNGYVAQYYSGRAYVPITKEEYVRIQKLTFE